MNPDEFYRVAFLQILPVLVARERSSDPEAEGHDYAVTIGDEVMHKAHAWARVACESVYPETLARGAK